MEMEIYSQAILLGLSHKTVCKVIYFTFSFLDQWVLKLERLVITVISS
jgi:hypothetical protein